MVTKKASLSHSASVDTTTTSIEDLLERAAELKGELVRFAKSSRFAKRVDALMSDAADADGVLDGQSAVLVLDRFALQYRFVDGRTVVQRFVDQRRPRLTESDQDMLLGWRDVVEGYFEVRRVVAGALELHNLVDDLEYRVYSNIGPRAVDQVRAGMFTVGRIVPLHTRVTDAWMVSGHLATLPKSAGHQIARVAAGELTLRPALQSRNPSLIQRGWETQAAHRADFIAQVGSDLVVLPPEQAQETMREHFRRQQQNAQQRAGRKLASEPPGPTGEELGSLPEELMEADDVGIIFDEVTGLTYCGNLGDLDALFADPTLIRRRTYRDALRDCLEEESTPPGVIRRLVARHPEGADPVFRALLRKPDFSWNRDGEDLLRRHKERYFGDEPIPRCSILGERLTELLRTAG